MEAKRRKIDFTDLVRALMLAGSADAATTRPEPRLTESSHSIRQRARTLPVFLGSNRL